VLSGCEAFNHRGSRHYVPPGSIAVVCPDELHDGEPAEDHFVYRTLYPSVALMQAVAADVWGKPVSGVPHFRASVVEDEALAAALAHCHGVLEDARSPLLERDMAMTAFLAWLLGAYGGFGAAPSPGVEPAPVSRARRFIDAHFADDISLDDLVAVAGIPRSRLLRAFRRTLGTTPYAYALDRRFRAARRLLAAGQTPADVAAACGFFDQSHLNRVFKARMGVTPGAFRA
jgi:AraC-like DNA-binding protein